MVDSESICSGNVLEHLANIQNVPGSNLRFFCGFLSLTKIKFISYIAVVWTPKTILVN